MVRADALVTLQKCRWRRRRATSLPCGGASDVVAARRGQRRRCRVEGRATSLPCGGASDVVAARRGQRRRCRVEGRAMSLPPRGVSDAVAVWRGRPRALLLLQKRARPARAQPLHLRLPQGGVGVGLGSPTYASRGPLARPGAVGEAGCRWRGRVPLARPGAVGGAGCRWRGRASARPKMLRALPLASFPASRLAPLASRRTEPLGLCRVLHNNRS